MRRRGGEAAGIAILHIPRYLGWPYISVTCMAGIFDDKYSKVEYVLYMHLFTVLYVLYNYSTKYDISCSTCNRV